MPTLKSESGQVVCVLGVQFTAHCFCVLCDGEDCVTGSSVSLESGHQEMEECGQGPMT